MYEVVFPTNMFVLVYLMFNTIPPTFEGQYGFPTRLTGLVYLSLGLGFVLGLWSFSKFSDRTVVRLTERNNGVFEPEMRLQLVVYYGKHPRFSLCHVSIISEVSVLRNY